MALPPTPLTTLLRGAPTPAAMYEALRADGCLSAAGRAGRPAVVALLAAVAARHAAVARAEPLRTGPSVEDEVARALVGSAYLTARGRGMNEPYREPAARRRAWWQVWR